MKTEILKMTRWMAKKEAVKWRAGKTATDEKIRQVYRAIARGEKILDLYQSMRRAGCDSQGRPKLAIARAWAQQAHFFCWLESKSWYARSPRFSSDEGYKNEVTVPVEYLPGLSDEHLSLNAEVPVVPPLFRQARNRIMWILFEAKWGSVTNDPILMEHMIGPLYRVVGIWDLTPVEQSVLRGER